MSKKYNFVYITTNLINGKQYIGDHSTDDLNCWNTINYLGSGIAINNARKIHGKKNFKREILEFFLTKQEAFNAQEKYIRMYKTHVSQGGYNISWKGGNCVKGCHSEETKIKIGLNNKKRTISDKTRLKMSKNNSGKNNPMFGKKMSDESKRLISLSKINKKHSPESISKMSKAKKGKRLTDETKEKLSKLRKGFIMSEEQKQKIGNALRNVPKPKVECPYCHKIIDNGNFKRWHGERCKSFLRASRCI